MSNLKKLMQRAAAGAAGGAGLDVDEVFSTYLYTGNGSTQTITNGIDLDGEGGLVWIKDRTTAQNHGLIDTVNNGLLFSNLTNAINSGISHTFLSDGFTVGSSGSMNDSGDDIASWTFRKAPKFFDVVTYTGDGNDNRTVSHNLGSSPGMVVVKRTDSADSWIVLHRSASSSNLFLNLTSAASSTLRIKSMDSTTFTLGTNAQVNGNGSTYVAYLFAHNDGDGEFGPDGDADIIKCGSYTGNGSSDGPEIDLGFEPQWVLAKGSTVADHWFMYDTMRGFPTSGALELRPNESGAEAARSYMAPTSTGFKLIDSNGQANGNGETYIYMAIRRGPLAPPESATDVFDIDSGDNDGSSSNPEFSAPFPVDAATLIDRTGGGASLRTRLTGTGFLRTYDTVNEVSNIYTEWDFQDGWFTTNLGSTYVSHMWKRAPNFFDVVAYTGTGSARTVTHNLGVAPEMMWVKCRSEAQDWVVYHKGMDSSAPEDYGIYLNDTTGRVNSANFWNDTAPTSSVFTVGTAAKSNGSSKTYIAYLFASLAGVSKVGSVSHTNGTDTNVDCGFSSGARFILLKRTDGASSWYCWDTERGIVAGDDQVLYLQSTLAEQTGDSVDPLSSGFTMEGVFDTGDYIFYAIA